jgi:hypothetical protein
MPQPGLVAQYDFNEGAGTVLHDVSGQGNDGNIQGQNVHWVKQTKGYCLEFNGSDRYVDCGAAAPFNFTDAVTLEAWVLPEGQPPTEAGLLGKDYGSYLLTYYTDGSCYWYINHSGVGNNVKAELSWGSWHHVAATYSSVTKRLELYVDGELKSFQDINPGSPSEIQPGQNFLIGLNKSLSGYVQGLIDDVRIYSRALSANEIHDHFETDEKELQVREYQPFAVVETIQAGSVFVRAGASGQIQVEMGSGACIVESMFSYPGARIAWNFFTASNRVSEPSWAVSIQKNATTLEIAAAGQSYSVSRRLSIHGDWIQIEDRLSNRRPTPTGFAIWNRLTADKPFVERLAPGFAENPTIHLQTETNVIGLVIEDDLSRLHFDIGIGLPRNQARFKITDIALDAGKDYTIRWTLYLLTKTADYFALINRVRQDWGTNFTVQGPFTFFDANPLANPILNDAAALQAYFQRKRAKIVALEPWLDYDPTSFDHVLSRADYKALVQSAISKIKTADVDIKCIGSIETDWVAINLDQLDPQNKIPRSSNTSQVTLDASQTKVIDDANLPWKQSAKRDPEGNVTLEYYLRGSPAKPQWSLGVYPEIGNFQHAFLLDQVKFLLGEVGLDGFYIDQFSQDAWYLEFWNGNTGGVHTHQAWDGWSVDMNERTGEIMTKYTDCSLVGIGARVDVCAHALAGGKIVVANTWSTSADEQTLPVYRFHETWGYFDPKATDLADFPDAGAEPQAEAALFRGNLASPIGLGTQAKNGMPVAKRLMKSVIAYLRHGLLYYHYNLPDIPPGQGGYGAINHMFPITPVALHEGWIEGKERIITAVSGKYDWLQQAIPKVHRFDLMGDEVIPAGFTTSKTGKGWLVEVKISDWAEIVVIE